VSISIAEYFESRYSNYERFWWNVSEAYSTNPDDVSSSLLAGATLRFAREHSAGRAIDIGSGEGADILRLARLGWEVDAVELTSAGCEKITDSARRLNVDVTVHHADIRNFETDKMFDLVICNGLLHYVMEKLDVCTKMQAMTKPGGANVIALWSEYTEVPSCHSELVPVFPDRERGETYSAYREWRKELLYFERNRADTFHKDMPPHVHSYIKMLAVNEPDPFI
jgi:2-polyprenyl-3-methyl-5-hydroxy-6-metoxy-1,4-benzoquinol methylase